MVDPKNWWELGGWPQQSVGLVGDLRGTQNGWTVGNWPHKQVVTPPQH